ncbi:MAG TPA: hypothetical protein VKB34_14515, partial [Povalibacter sp.]|nr:hypothetical protein [Povalibacter sp.]
ALRLSQSAPAWFWHVRIANAGVEPLDIDCIHTQDIALAPYDLVRLNEYYVSQYVDHAPLVHDARGWVVASRQNLAVQGRNPWCAIGSLRHAVAFATDAMQVHGLASRAGLAPVAMHAGLPSRRLQHEHSMVALQDERTTLAPGGAISLGFFGLLRNDHPAATSVVDLAAVDEALRLPEAAALPVAQRVNNEPAGNSLFSAAPLLQALDLDTDSLRRIFPGEWRHVEVDADGAPLSFFHGEHRHVVLRQKELRVQRPHGHLLHTARGAIPDECALTSTVWMAGVFHSMLTQGHVSINRLLSTVRSYLGLFRSHGQRVLVDCGSGWQLLDVPSAFEMTPDACRWIYRHAQGLVEVRSEAKSEPHEMLLRIEAHSGPPLRCMISHHVALNGDGGTTAQPLHWSSDPSGIRVRPAADTDLGRRFPDGYFHIEAASGGVEQVGGDELLFLDGRSRQQPYICVVTRAAVTTSLRLRGQLVSASRAVALPRSGTMPAITLPAASSLSLSRLAEILPWYAHDAWIHYLAPRGLEQYSGGGWGTRDVTQGAVEMLLALGDTAPIRDLLLRVMAAQNPDGDWPQWFTFYERERHIRAGDSHGDIVFWPLLALAQYLIASGDAGVLEERVSFFATDTRGAEVVTVWQHVQRALSLIERRVIPGTSLAAYGHGDWNDSLQPADPALREQMCSAWTVTLHHQAFTLLARALRLAGRTSDAERLDGAAAAVLESFQRELLPDGVLTGYVVFDGKQRRYLLHPRDTVTGVRYSALAMVHAILAGMFTPTRAHEHLQLIRSHLLGPDGLRLFDEPLPYRGGPQQIFQRAESAAFFGREIGLMYMHAHLRYAQALACVGDADAFFHALCQANPIGLQSIVPSASLRQVNCYYSSSDAAFADRYQASATYEAVVNGTIALDGGWRIYSSGPGIALGLIVRHLLGLSVECDAWILDPVLPADLDGLKVQTRLSGHPVEIAYEVRSPGHGVTAVLLNGIALTLSYDHNPYRRGAARVAARILASHLKPQSNVLTIRVGGAGAG